jgi:5-methylcytosine-specific restriction protein A
VPTRAATPCRHPGCPALTTDGICLEHRKAEQQHDREVRGSAYARGYTKAWSAYSKRYRYEHPWCVACLKEGRNNPSQEVDHIQAVSGPDDPLFWEPSNHQALCHSHHSAKTATENRHRPAAKPQPVAWFA